MTYSPMTWAKQRRTEFRAGQLSHQQSISVSNMSNAAAIDMDDGERKIVNEFCHYLEKSKQLFNGLRFGGFHIALLSLHVAYSLTNLK